MRNSQSAHFNEVKEAVKRFELMEVRRQSVFFDVHTIENIFDFYADKLQFDKAARVIELGIKLHPQATSLKVRKADIYIESDLDDQALSLLNELLVLEPSNPEIYLNLGWLYLRRKQPQEAFAIFDEGLKTDFDGEENFLLDVALYLNQFGYFDQVIKILEPRRNSMGNNESLLFEFAYANHKADRDYMALSLYSELLEINPFSENAWYNKGLIMLKIGELGEAMTCLDYVLALNPHHSRAYFNKGNSLAQSNRYAEALDNYLEYISYTPFSSEVLHYIADCWSQLENHHLAPRFFELAIITDPLDFYPWQGFANYHLANDEPRKCRKIIKEALKEEDLFWDNTKAALFFISAQSYMLEENWRMARMYLKRAVLDDPYTLKYLFDLYQLQKNLLPAYTLGSFIKQYIHDFHLIAAFKYMEAAFQLFELGAIESGLVILKRGIKINPASFEPFAGFFPQIYELAGQNEQLARLVEKHL